MQGSTLHKPLEPPDKQRAVVSLSSRCKTSRLLVLLLCLILCFDDVHDTGVCTSLRSKDTWPDCVWRGSIWGVAAGSFIFLAPTLYAAFSRASLSPSHTRTSDPSSNTLVSLLPFSTRPSCLQVYFEALLRCLQQHRNALPKINLLWPSLFLCFFVLFPL